MAASNYAAAWRPPPKLSLSEWADKNFRLSAGSADAGKWVTRPYQREILDAICDPDVERVSVMKSARIGWTELVKVAIAYFMAEDPCSMLGVLPTVETAEIYSREMIAPMLRDVPALANLVHGSAVKTTGRTLLHKSFPGGVLSLVGANSGAGFAMISRRVVACDEVDRYPPSAGDEGDPIALAEKRTQTFWNRKILAGSTPLITGSSRIEQMFEAGDQRRRYWPCPQCGHLDFLTPNQKSMRGHILRWPDGRPDAACFECRGNGCVIEEHHKRDMDEAGEWRADAPGNGTSPSGRQHASFHVWSAYSTSPNASWGQIATEFRDASKLGPEKLRTVVNTTFGESWQERGEAPDHERLYERREPYALGTVPDPAIIVLTCGVDVQRDRFVYEIVGWASNRESWSIDYGEIHGDTAIDATWLKLDILLNGGWQARDVAPVLPIAMLAIDSGAFTQPVYDWARRHPMSRVIAVKGDEGPRPIIGTASPVDVNFRGKRLQRGYRVFVVGVDTIKSELYGWLSMPRGDGDPPAGWCHFPEHDPAYFKQLTAEHLVTVVNRTTNRSTRRWQVITGRENHALDCRVYARAAAALLGIDRMASAARAPAAAAPSDVQPGAMPPPRAESPAATSEVRPRRLSNLLGKARGNYWGKKRP